MSKVDRLPLTKVTLNLFKGDKEILERFYPSLGWSVAARRIINKFSKQLLERESQEIVTSDEPLDIDVPNIEESKEDDGEASKST